jgi:predicted RNA-binding protein YlqC (UPF0109 family)
MPEPAPLVVELARRLVRHPEAVSVEERSGTAAQTLVLRVDGSDMGAIIGRGGRTAQALRALLAAAGSRHRRRFHLEIVE